MNSILNLFLIIFNIYEKQLKIKEIYFNSWVRRAKEEIYRIYL